MPLHVLLKNKKYSINMNPFRNWHFQEKSRVKNQYQVLASREICKLPLMDKIKLEFKLIPGDKIRRDRANVCALHEKFFCDALTKCKIIEDDCDRFIESTFYHSGEIDRKNPRMEITIYDLSSSKVEESR